jgi:hypothetical protein
VRRYQEAMLTRSAMCIARTDKHSPQAPSSHRERKFGQRRCMHRSPCVHVPDPGLRPYSTAAPAPILAGEQTCRIRVFSRNLFEGPRRQYSQLISTFSHCDGTSAVAVPLAGLSNSGGSVDWLAATSTHVKFALGGHFGRENRFVRHDVVWKHGRVQGRELVKVKRRLPLAILEISPIVNLRMRLFEVG